MVQRIKAVPNETKLLVVDKETEEYYRKMDIMVKGSMKNVLRLSSEAGNVHNFNKNNTNSNASSRHSSINESVVPVNTRRKHSSSAEESPSSTGKVQKNYEILMSKKYFDHILG